MYLPEISLSGEMSAFVVNDNVMRHMLQSFPDYNYRQHKYTGCSKLLIEHLFRRLDGFLYEPVVDPAPCSNATYRSVLLRPIIASCYITRIAFSCSALLL